MNGSRRLCVRLFFMWLWLLAQAAGGKVMAQVAADGSSADNVQTVCPGMLYFSRGNAGWIEGADYKVVKRFLHAPAAKSGSTSQPRNRVNTTPSRQKQQPKQVPEQRPQQEQTLHGKATPSSGRYLCLKTNLTAWAGTVMNITADVQAGRHLSVELPVLWCPWYVSSKHAVRTFTLQPEARWWLRQPGAGHFFGIHAHMGWFNVKWNGYRYQDTGRPFFGAGLSYGYVLLFGAHWAGEFTLGAGYTNICYNTYYNIDHGVQIDTRTRNYWGITRAGLSVVYRFSLKK